MFVVAVVTSFLSGKRQTTSKVLDSNILLKIQQKLFVSLMISV